MLNLLYPYSIGFFKNLSLLSYLSSKKTYYNKGMDRESFLNQYPARDKNSNKFNNGRILLVAGSYGMAGACILNLIGARTMGVSYVYVSLPDSIYPIVSSQDITAVYYPSDTYSLTKALIPSGLLDKVDAIGFGSGLTKHPEKEAMLQALIQKSSTPLVIDAEGLRILANKPSLLNHHTQHIILTPHMGEFANLSSRSMGELERDKETIAINYAKQHHIYLVLKGPKTLIISPQGDITINHSGNEALAQAGSGDVLTGMITGMCALNYDVYAAIIASVWFHGHLADVGVQGHSKVNFDLRRYPELADQFFRGVR